MQAALRSHAITLTELRGNLYKLIDQTIETGVPIEIERKGHILKVSLEKTPSKMSRLIARPETITQNGDDLLHADWMKNWNPLL